MKEERQSRTSGNLPSKEEIRCCLRDNPDLRDAVDHEVAMSSGDPLERRRELPYGLPCF